MDARVRERLVLTLVASLFVLLCLCLTRIEAQNATLKAQNATIEARNTTTKAQNATVEAQNATTEAQNATTEAQNATTEAQNATTEAQNATTEAQNATTEAQGATELPKVCTGQNPIVFDGIKGPWPYNDEADFEARRRLAEKLENESVELVRIYCTLREKMTTYGPGSRPGKDLTSAGSLVDKTDEAMSLAFVFGRSSEYVETYLKIHAPLRFYSLGLLAKKVEWNSQEDQTLRMRVSSELLSCWENSNTSQRMAFLHHTVSNTLTDILQGLQPSKRQLPGTLYMRRNVNVQNGLWFPYPFGYVPAYSKCDKPYPSPNMTYISRQNFSVCRWTELEQGFLFLEDLWKGVGIVNIIVSVLVAIFIDKILNKAPFGWLHDEDKAGNPHEHSCCRDGNENKDTTKFDGSFPAGLTVSYVMRHAWNNKEWPCTSHFCTILVRGLFALFVLGLLAVLFVANIYAANYFLQDFDTLDTWIHTKGDDNNPPLLWSVGYTLLTFLVIVLAVVFSYLIRNLPSETTRQKWGSHQVSAYRAATIVVFLLLGAGVTGVLTPVLLNFFTIVCFTAVGLFVNWPGICLGAGAIAKLLWFNILKIGSVNDTVSPKIATCKIATDEVVRDWKNSIIKKRTAKLVTDAQRSAEKEGEARRPAAEQLQREIELMYTGYILPGSPSTNPIVINDEDIEELRTHTFLILCATQGAAGDSDLENPLKASVSLQESQGSLATQNKKIYDALVETVAWNFIFYVVKAISIGWLIASVLGTLQTLLVYAGNLTDTKLVSSLVLPGLLVLGSIYKILHERKVPTGRSSQLRTDAKRILYLLLGDDVVKKVRAQDGPRTTPSPIGEGAGALLNARSLPISPTNSPPDRLPLGQLGVARHSRADTIGDSTC